MRKFQDNLTSYLQGTPDDIFTWFAGYRMRYFADQGLLTPIDDVWAKIGSNYSDAFKAASTGNDGKVLLHPVVQLPVGRDVSQERVRRTRATPFPRPGTSSSPSWTR